MSKAKSNLKGRFATVIELISFFLKPSRWIFLPMLFVLLLAGILLILTDGMAYVAPFVYTLF